jgi:hypothetical protein
MMIPSYVRPSACDIWFPHPRLLLVYEGLAHDPEKLTDFSDKIMRKTRVGVSGAAVAEIQAFPDFVPSGRRSGYVVARRR